MVLKSFHYRRCDVCGLQFQPVTWLPWRRAGICCEQCAEALARSMGEREVVMPELPRTGDLFGFAE